MTIKIGTSKPKAIDFTHNGVSLAVRKLPLRLGLLLQREEGDVSPDLLAEILATCVVHEDGVQAFTKDEALDFDLDVMLKLFDEVSASASMENAEKN